MNVQFFLLCLLIFPVVQVGILAGLFCSAVDISFGIS